MKTIGTCENCEHWTDCAIANPELYKPGEYGDCAKWNPVVNVKRVTLGAFGCIHWQDKGRKPDLPNYPTKTPEQLRIETLERENDAAFEKICQLSKALAEFGIDPTQLPDDTRI